VPGLMGGPLGGPDLGVGHRRQAAARVGGLQPHGGLAKISPRLIGEPEQESDCDGRGPQLVAAQPIHTALMSPAVTSRRYGSEPPDGTSANATCNGDVGIRVAGEQGELVLQVVAAARGHVGAVV
jgi:hypothetical protein